MKLFYAMPLLVVLGMFGSAEASDNDADYWYDHVAKYQAKIDKVDAKIERLETRQAQFDPVDNADRINQLQAKIDRQLERKASLELEIDLEAHKQDILKKIGVIEVRIIAIENKINNLGSDASQQKIDRLQSKLDRLGERQDDLVTIWFKLKTL